LTTQHGRCDDISQSAQNVVSIPDTQEESESSRGARLAPPYGIEGHRRQSPHYGHGSSGIHHGFGGLVTAHHGLGGHRGLELIHGRGLGDVYGSGFHGGLLGRYHTLPLHGARQASDDNEFDSPNRLIVYGHPERNQISGIVPAFETLPVSQKYGMPLVQTNQFYEPYIRYNIVGINTSSYPTRQWHYPGVGVHGIGVDGFHGMGLGVNYGAGTPEQYSKGFSGRHAGWTSAFNELNKVHGMAGLRTYNSGDSLNGLHRNDARGGKTGLPVRGIPGHYGEVIGHGVKGVPAMEIHKSIPNIHGSSSSGYGSTMGEYQGLANDHNFGLHKDMHIGGTGKYHGAGQYHGNGYYGMAGYDRDEYLGDGYHGSGYHGSGYHTNGHHGINGYHRGGYHGNNYHGGGYKGVNSYCGMNGHYERGCHKGGVAGHHGPFKYGGSLQGPMSHGRSNQLDDKLETDQNSKFSVFKGKIYLKQDKHDKMRNNKKDSSEQRNQPPHNDGNISGLEILEAGMEDTNYKMEDNNERASLPEGMGNESKDNTNPTPSYSVVQHELVKQKNAMHGYINDIYSDSIVRSNKANDMETLSRHDTTSSDNLSRKTKLIMSNNFLYKTGMPVADYPSVLSNGEEFATPYARGLHVDLLHGGTATLDAGNSVQVPGELGLTGAETALGGAQKGIPTIPGGTDLTEMGNHGSTKIQQHQQNPQELGHLLGYIPDTLVGVGLGFQGHQSNDNTDGKLWTGYDSHKYDYHGVDFGYGLVPSTFWPWYNSYDRYYMTPYPIVHTDYGYGLRQFGMDGCGCVIVRNNLGLDGKLRVGLL
jgi:hypothetical protein